MSFSNTQLPKNMPSQLFMTLRIRKNMSFLNMQLVKNMTSQLFLWHHKSAKIIKT